MNPAATDERGGYFLYPTPRHIEHRPGRYTPADHEPQPVTAVDPGRVPQPQGYRLSINTDGIEIVGHDAAGVFYGQQTLKQLTQTRPNAADPALPCLTVEDWPDLSARGYLLDVSRDRVPTMDHLRQVIDTMAGLKLNQLQLYTEHTFAFRGHESVWQDASPLTPEQIKELEAYAAPRFIDLVPCQNVFGHLHHWLTKPAYRELAECPDGWDTPWGYRSPEPFSLNPGDPRSFDLSRDMIRQLADTSGSGLFNICCDETMDIGQGRSHDRVQREGRAAVYLDYLTRLCEEVHSHRKTPMFWGDIVLHHPELIERLPGDAVLLNWGYEAKHPFDQQSQTFAEAGVRFYVCPGTSGWCTLTGRGHNAVENLRAGAEAAVRHGAEGYLITDWGDYGHWQPYPVCLPGLVYGAGVAWNYELHADAAPLAAAISQAAVGDPADAVGQLIWDASNVYQLSDAKLFNATWWFQYLRSPDRAMEPVSETDAQNVAEAFESLDEKIDGHLSNDAAARPLLEELSWSVRVSAWAARQTAEGIRRGSFENSDAKASPAFAELLEEYRRLWLRRSRPGGLEASVEKLARPHVESPETARAPF